MKQLVNIKFISTSDSEETFVEAKGYKNVEGDTTTIFFRNEHKYKFIITNNSLEVQFDDSEYHFELNKETKGIIKNSEYSINTKILTKKLDIDDKSLRLEYTIDFGVFQTEHTIILELH